MSDPINEEQLINEIAMLTKEIAALEKEIAKDTKEITLLEKQIAKFK